VQDGEKIEVLSKQETAAAQVPARPGATTAPVYPEKRPFTGKVSINTASAAALQQLSGIGPGYAQRIIDYRARLRREEGRGFASIEELMNVPGIGPKRFSEIRDHVTL
jgi:competence protein ComEA